MSGERDPGFAGMVQAGVDPAEAYAVIREQCAHPAVRAIIISLTETREGREALEYSRARWAEHGFDVPPWEVAAGE